MSLLSNGLSSTSLNNNNSSSNNCNSSKQMPTSSSNGSDSAADDLSLNGQEECCSKEDLELLARLEAQNKLIETDLKSLNSLNSTSGHSRKSSDTSLISDSLSQVVSEADNDQAFSDDLWKIWGQLIADWPNQYKKRTTFIKELVRKGIPNEFRRIVWQLLCNAQTCVARDKYPEYLRQVSPCEKVIKRDIARTYPEHDFFKEKDGPGQEGLYNVMKAYSLHDPEVGYCQGSAFLVGVLLLQMPEEDAFAVVVRLMEDYRFREMYKPTMAELGLCIYQLECMVQEFLPELYHHFQSQNYYTSMYASSWFLTIFTSCFPLNLAYRVIDIFLSEGIEMIFRLSVAVLMLCKEELLKLDMEGLLKYFQKEMPARCEIDPDYLISCAMQFKYDQKKMKKIAKDYTTLKTKEQEEMIELRRLRTENRLLRQRIENLEQESAELADKLIQGQVSRAQEAEDNFAIKRELSASIEREKELTTELLKSTETIKQLEDYNSIKISLECRETQQIIDSLQEELIAVKLREAENNDEMKGLRERINDLEEINKRLREIPPDHAVAQLQEELIAVKLREAEANLSMKELRQRIADLQQMWQDHLSTFHVNQCPHHNHAHQSANHSDTSQPNSLDSCCNSLGSNSNSCCNSYNSNINNNNNNNNNNVSTSTISSVTSSPLKMLGNSLKRNNTKDIEYINEINKLKQELMSAKLREAEAIGELKELRQKVMELETQIQVSMNQIRRQADELNKTKEKEVSVNEKEKQLLKQIQEEKRKYIDIDSRYKEQQMMNRIKYLEQTQIIAELKQKLSGYEVKKEEMVTVQKLIESGSEPQDRNELQDRMAELQSEMFRLDAQRRKLGIMGSFTNGIDDCCIDDN